MANWEELPTLDCETTVALGGINGKTGKPNPTKLEGYFLGSKEVPSKLSKTGTAKLHIFQTEKGNVGVWGKANLDKQLSNVTAGTMTQATFVGKKPSKYGQMYEYKVRIDRTNTIAVAAPEESSIETAAADDYDSEVPPSYGGEDEPEESLFSDEGLDDEIAPPMPKKPSRPVTTTSPDRAAKVQALLNRR